VDNLVKGQAGSALQNLNVMFGLRETMGLDQPAQHP
jgi:N-acetyl-gamma-glutamyl-phosphate reductase